MTRAAGRDFVKHPKLPFGGGGSDRVHTHFGNILLISYKIKHTLTCEPAIALLDHCPNEMQKCSQEDFCVSVPNGFTHNNRKQELARVPSSG